MESKLLWSLQDDCKSKSWKRQVAKQVIEEDKLRSILAAIAKSFQARSRDRCKTELQRSLHDRCWGCYRWEEILHPHSQTEMPAPNSSGRGIGCNEIRQPRDPLSGWKGSWQHCDPLHRCKSKLMALTKWNAQCTGERSSNQFSKSACFSCNWWEDFAQNFENTKLKLQIV